MAPTNRSNGMIPSDLYQDLPKFIDKKTLLEYINGVSNGNHSIAADLRQSYNENFLPFEENFKYKEYNTTPLGDAFFNSKPMILLIGQYSSGKSTFVRYLIDKDYPGIRIGPEPTTDKFVAVMHGEENAIIPGNALVIDDSREFKPLIKFGSKFLNRFQGALVNSTVLKGITIIDTPGILTDNNNSDGYDYQAVIEWFAQQADRIFLFVDANKLELSGDFQQIVEMIRIHDDKLRIVLNKTDLVTEQELIRLYGALMWFLGQSLNMREVVQIYVGSFWGQPIKNETTRRLYESEEFRIFEDLSNLPKENLLRKINLLAKRTKEVIIYSCVVSAFKEKSKKSAFFRYVFKKQIKQVLIKRLNRIYNSIEKEYDFAREDFPNLENMKKALVKTNLNKVKIYNKKLFANKDQFINEEIPKTIDRINNERCQQIFYIQGESPFYFAKGEGFDEGSMDHGEWIVNKYKDQYAFMFDELKNEDNKVTGSKAKALMLRSNLPSKILNKVWTLADIDQDGMLDWDEFALAFYLIGVKLKNFELPSKLPQHLIPPSKRRLT